MINSAPPPEKRAVYGIMWKNAIGPDTSQLTKRRMHIARWIPKATNTHSKYVILIAFPRQQWSHEHSLSFLIMWLQTDVMLCSFLIIYNIQTLLSVLQHLKERKCLPFTKTEIRLAPCFKQPNSVGAIAKLRNVTKGSVASVCPSVHPFLSVHMEWIVSQWTKIH